MDAAGVTINWSADGGATLDASSTVTDGNGMASVNVTDTGPGPFSFTVTAVRADEPSAIVVFNEGVLPPQLTIVSGDNQNGLTQRCNQPLEVQLVDGGGIRFPRDDQLGGTNVRPRLLRHLGYRR